LATVGDQGEEERSPGRIRAAIPRHERAPERDKASSHKRSRVRRAQTRRVPKRQGCCAPFRQSNHAGACLGVRARAQTKNRLRTLPGSADTTKRGAIL
jgi:hypothetical protein